MLLGENISAIKRAFDLYLSLGGFPEIIKNQDVMLADQYFKDIIHRDVISRYNIRNVKEISESWPILTFSKSRTINTASPIRFLNSGLNNNHDNLQP